MSSSSWKRSLQARREHPEWPLGKLALSLNLATSTVSLHLRQARMAGEEVPYTGGRPLLPLSVERLAATLSATQRDLLRAVAAGAVVNRPRDGAWHTVRTDIRLVGGGGARVTKSARVLADRGLAVPPADPTDRVSSWRLTELGEQVLAAADAAADADTDQDTDQDTDWRTRR